jgi:hypothetical protein
MAPPTYTSALIVGAGQRPGVSLTRLLRKEGLAVAIAARDTAKLAPLWGAEVANVASAITLNTIMSREREDHHCDMAATARHNHSNLYVAGRGTMTSARTINSILSKVALRSGSPIQSNFDTT